MAYVACHLNAGGGTFGSAAQWAAGAGAYGLLASPALFHGSPLPAEVAFDDSSIELMRPRRAADEVLNDQRHVIQKQATIS